MDQSLAPAAQNRRLQAAVVSIALFTLLVGVYLLSYSGIYHSGDEIGYVRDATQIIRATASSLGHGGPFALVLASVLGVAQKIPFVGTLQAQFLISIVSTGLAAVFLFLLGLELKYDRCAALIVALLYGLASPAWVYSKLLFRDPFVATALIALAYFLVRFRVHRSFVSLGLGILAGAIAIATRPSAAVVAPFALLYVTVALLAQSGASKSGKRIPRPVVVLVVVVLLIAVGASLAAVFTLYTKWLDRLLRFFEHRDALAGLLVSPGRGILFYVPIVVLALAGLVRFARRHPWETVLLYGPIPFALLMVSVHPMWWGGWNWGPRYVVPFLPYLLFPIIALIEPLVTGQWPRWGWIPIAAVVLLSFLTEAVGAAIGPNTGTFQNMEPGTFFAWYYAPLALLGSLGQSNPDLAWLHLRGGAANAVWVVVPALLVLVLSVWLLWRGLRRSPAIEENSSKQASRRLLAAAIGILLLTAAVSAWSIRQYYRLDTRYRSPDGYAEAVERVRTEGRPNDLFVFDHWTTEDVHIRPSQVDNFCRGVCPPVREVVRNSWSITPVDMKLKWLDGIRWNQERVWYLPGSNLSEADPVSEVKPWLDTYLFQADCEQFSSDTSLCTYYNLTPSEELSPVFGASLFEEDRAHAFLPLVVSANSPKRDPQWAGPRGASIEFDALFGDRIQLSDVRLYQPASSPPMQTRLVTAQPGEPILIELLWQALAPIDNRAKVSLQLVDASGQLVHQIDREPVDGLWPTTSWQPGRPVSDRYALVLPGSLQAGDYQVLLVVYDPLTGERLPTATGDALKIADVAVVAQETRP